MRAAPLSLCRDAHKNTPQSLQDNAQADAEIKKPSPGHLPDRFHKIRFGIAFPHNLDPKR